MPFDQDSRNRLDHFVGDARALLTKEFTNQLQQRYGMDPSSGSVAPIDVLSDLDDSQRETARILRETLAYYQPEKSDKKGATKEILNRILHEQAFTVLNRICALRLAEARGLILESISKGYQSEGFQLYKALAGPALGETMEAYQTYLFSVFDELAVELPPLFDRFSPEGRLFPGQTALQDLLALINDPELEALWSEDETIGWIYQYFNSQEERRAMRDASRAPRNSRELAVRNQFFTPRYVVEFLTDNTLGRIWLEMTRSQTGLLESCNYLVRRKHTFFLGEGEKDPEPFDPLSTPIGAPDLPGDMWLPPNPDLEEIEHIFQYALTVGGYNYAKEHLGVECGDLANTKLKDYQENGKWEGTFEELRCCLFFEQRRYHHFGRVPEDEEKGAIQDLYQAICERWDFEVEFVPYRQLKDPREIKMLDPACGSMHFGLYAFELFERIYAEAWELEEEKGEDALWRLADLDSLLATYPNKESLLVDVPRLIIERNIHGIDIDPRAVQIAGLSLWLRAQKSWAALDIKRIERPQILKSNVICAEPMPGNREMLEDFLLTLDQTYLKEMLADILPTIARHALRITDKMVQALRNLIRSVWNAMEMAGEAGSLLKIDKILRQDINNARKKSDEDFPLLHALDFEMGDPIISNDLDFWNYSERLVMAALGEYSERAINGQTFQRKLFSNDAIQGFAFINLNKKLYDVILMNPPFGEEARTTRKYIVENYPLSKGNLLANFVDRGLELINSSGLIGTITSRSCYYLGSFSAYREKLLIQNADFTCFADLGEGVLDSMVETAAYCFSKISGSKNLIPFFRLMIEKEKDKSLLTTISCLDEGKSDNRLFLSKLNWFNNLPGSTFTYWIDLDVIKKIDRFPPIEPAGCHIAVGLQTGFDWRFLRLVWEVNPEQIAIINYDKSTLNYQEIQDLYLDNFNRDNVTWGYFSKTDEAIPFFSPVHLLVKWKQNGKEIKNFADENGKIRSRPQNSDFYFLPGISYMARTTRLVPYIVPAGVIPTAGRSTVFPNPKNETSVLLLLASNLGSAVTRFSGEKFGWPMIQKGMVQEIPYRKLSSSIEKNGKTIIDKQIRKRREKYQYLEPFQEFLFFDYFSDPEEFLDDLRSFLGDDLEIEIANDFGIKEEGYRQLERDIVEALSLRGQANELGVLTKQEQKADKGKRLLSFLLGSCFGRWDIRFATGERSHSDLNEPFAPLPVCPPGMLQNKEGFPAKQNEISDDYPLRISWKGILVNDPGNQDDIQTRTREALQAIYNDKFAMLEAEICQNLNVDSFRSYFLRETLFFEHHYKQYSQSRRYAPIYWPLTTPSGSYTLWLYYHRIDDQILFTCVNDFVDPKLKQVSADIARLRSKHDRSRVDESNLEELTNLEIELKEFREELLRVAAFWKPNLNDGVEITASPLWRLFQHRSWQKRLRDTWEKLEEGEYDWAHLAYSIWPERVREKCKIDKSIAIAHDLEHLYQGE